MQIYNTPDNDHLIIKYINIKINKIKMLSPHNNINITNNYNNDFEYKFNEYIKIYDCFNIQLNFIRDLFNIYSLDELIIIADYNGIKTSNNYNKLLNKIIILYSKIVNNNIINIMYYIYCISVINLEHYNTLYKDFETYDTFKHYNFFLVKKNSLWNAICYFNNKDIDDLIFQNNFNLKILSNFINIPCIIKYRTWKIKITIDKNIDINDNYLECPICLLNFKNDDKHFIKLNCNHYFCDTCITSQLKYNNLLPKCALCRININEISINNTSDNFEILKSYSKCII